MDYRHRFLPDTVHLPLSRDNMPGVLSSIYLPLVAFFILCFFGSQNLVFADSASISKLEQTATISNSQIQQAFNNVSGITRVNLTAGTGNLQQNAAALAIIDDGFNAVAQVESTQLSDNPAIKNLQLMSAEIGTGAFNGARGMTSINQSAGADNTQLNAMAIAVGGARPFAIVEMNESQLLGETPAGPSGQSTQAGNSSHIHAVTGLAKDAFNGARGVIQVNQAAGVGNLTSNSFTMSVSK